MNFIYFILQTIGTMLIVATSVVYIVDFTGIVEWLKKKIYYIKFSKNSPYVIYNLKPFDCSGCLSVWVFLLYTLIIGSFTLYSVPLALCTGAMAIAIRKIIIY